MSPAPHAPCGGQHCPVVAMLLAPRSNPLPSHCHIPLPCPLPASARHAPMSPPLPRSPGHERRPEAGLPQDGVRSGEHRLGHTDAALDAPRVVDVLRAHATVAPSASSSFGGMLRMKRRDEGRGRAREGSSPQVLHFGAPIPLPVTPPWEVRDVDEQKDTVSLNWELGDERSSAGAR